jgi:hypothetical protein
MGFYTTSRRIPEWQEMTQLHEYLWLLMKHPISAVLRSVLHSWFQYGSYEHGQGNWCEKFTMSRQLKLKRDNSMGQSLSWEANSRSLSQEIATFHRIRKLYRINKSPPLVPILKRVKPAHNFSPCFSKIYFNIILLFLPASSKWYLPFRISNQNFVCISDLSHACYILSSCFYV